MKKTVQSINKFVLLLLLILGISCHPEPDGPPHVIVSIDDEFEIDLWETLARDVSSLGLHIATIAAVDCEDTTIDIEYKKNGDDITMALNGIIDPINCVPANVQAQSTLNIGHLFEKTYNFDINLEGTTIINKGTLTVSKESYTLNMESENGFRLQHKTLLRVPSQTIWGAVNFKNTASSFSAAAAFLRDIKGISAEKEYPKGYYGYFSINENQMIEMDLETELPNNELFIFDYTKNIEELQGLIDRYREDFGEHLEIQVSTWNGKEL